MWATLKLFGCKHNYKGCREWNQRLTPTLKNAEKITSEGMDKANMLMIQNEGERGREKKNILHTLPLKMQLNGLSLAISAILELRCLGSI